jgi:hypothetical protein
MMQLDPTQILVKTAANYIAFKVVKSTVDNGWNHVSTTDQYSKAVECQFCKNVFANSPLECPDCGCFVMKKLYREYDTYKKTDENGFEIDTNLALIQGGKK